MVALLAVVAPRRLSLDIDALKLLRMVGFKHTSSLTEEMLEYHREWHCPPTTRVGFRPTPRNNCLCIILVLCTCILPTTAVKLDSVLSIPFRARKRYFH